MKPKPISSPLRTALIYLFFGALWIMTSDTALGFFIDHTSEIYPIAQTIKGWLFVLVGAVLLYMILQMDLNALQKEEEQSKESQARFRNLVERMPAITYVASVDDLSTTLYISPQIEAILGFSPTEFISDPHLWGQQIHPLDREHTFLAIHESQKNQSAFDHEYRMLAQDGRVVWFRDQSNLVKDETGKPLFYEGFMVEITERKQTEEALRMSEENYRNLAETSDSAIAVLDRNGTLLYANPTSLHLWNDPQLVGKTVYDLFPKELADRYLLIMQRVIKDHIIDLNELETQINGKTMWFQVSMSPLKNSDGSVNTLLLNAFDLTERKKAEEARRTSDILFFKIFRASSIGIHLFRLTDGRSYNVNDAFLEIIGYTREELVGHTAEELNLFVDIEIRDQWVSQLREGRRITNQDARIRHKSGKIRNTLASLDILEMNGERMVLVIVTDITERKKAEDLLRQSEEHYRNTLDGMLEGIQIIDFDWRYTYVNEAVAQQGQSTPEKLLGRTMMEAYPGIEYTELFSILRDCMKNRTVTRFENQFTFPDGTSGWFELIVQPAPEGIFILSVDITERKKAEEQLRSSEERFRLMAENIEEGFWITDPANGTEIYLSPGIERIFARSNKDLTHKPFAFLENVLPEDMPLVLTGMERQKIGEATSLEYRIQRPDGTLRWIWDRAFPILNNDKTVKFVTGLTTDITNRKETDARIQTQIKRLSALNSIDRAISSSMGLHISLDVLLIEVVAQLGVDSASILLLNDTTHTLDFVASKGFRTSAIEHSSMRLGTGLAGLVGSERKVIHVPNLPALGDDFQRKELLKDEQFLEYYGVPLLAKGQLKGVLEIFNREELKPDPEWLNYLETLGGQAAIAIENAQLFEGLQKSNQELFMAYDATIAGWSHAMDLRDKETEGHTQRVTELTIQLAERLGIGQQEQVHIRRGALLHDIGKLGVPDHILLKPGKLTEEEWVIMRKHPTYARDMLTSIHYLRPALDIPYCHHEKWDGSGYPNGLKGEEIPLAARLFAVVDVWDALRSDRPYREGWSASKTRDYIQAESGKHFDPQVVEHFLELLKEHPDS